MNLAAVGALCELEDDIVDVLAVCGGAFGPDIVTSDSLLRPVGALWIGCVLALIGQFLQLVVGISAILFRRNCDLTVSMRHVEAREFACGLDIEAESNQVSSVQFYQVHGFLIKDVGPLELLLLEFISAHFILRVDARVELLDCMLEYNFLALELFQLLLLCPLHFLLVNLVEAVKRRCV